MDSAPPSTQPSARPRKLRLDELLVVRGLAENRSQAQRLILAGEVSVGDRVLDKAGQAVPENAEIHVVAGLRFVSRGGLKLEHALHAFVVDPTGWTCADIGASTGGFTDCLLQHGALEGIRDRRWLWPVGMDHATGLASCMHGARQHQGS